MKNTWPAFEVGEQGGQVARSLEHRPRGAADGHAQLGGDDVRERRLAETGRPAEQHVVEHVAARARGVDLHAQILAHVLLADVLVERARPQRGLDEEVLVQRLRHDGTRRPVRHALPRQSLQRGPDDRLERFAVRAPRAARRARPRAGGSPG